MVGINTARSLTFKDGRINERQMQRLHERFAPLDDSLMKIVVTHHPFDLRSDMARRSWAARRRPCTRSGRAAPTWSSPAICT